MGRRKSEVPEETRLVPYEVVENKDGRAGVRIDGKDLSPPEISAMILQKLKSAAEAYLGHDGEGRGDHRARPISTTRSARPPRTPARSPASR